MKHAINKLMHDGCSSTLAAGFASPEERREASQYIERFRQAFDEKQVLYKQEEASGRQQYCGIEPPIFSLCVSV